MTTILLLFAAGVILLAFEVVMPGGVLGVAGGIAIVAGVIVAFVDYGLNGGVTASAVALLLTALALYLEFSILPRSRLARSLSMTATVAGTSQPAIADRKQIVGRQAVAVTALAPSGYVEIDGRRYEAFARHGHTQPGERLEVVDLDNFRLIVSKPSTPA